MSKPDGQTTTIQVNLANERTGKQSETAAKKSDEHRVVIKYTKQIDFGSLRSYLDRTLKSINEDVLEAISKCLYA